MRVIAATNRSLQQLVKQGKFREDLYYRLNVVKIDLPPLRERPGGHPAAGGALRREVRRAGRAAQADRARRRWRLLLSYPWPGNIRELENAIERACVTSRDSVIEPENLPPELCRRRRPQPAVPTSTSTAAVPDLLREVIASIEKQYIRKALKKSRGNVGRCAKICGLSRRSITAKIAEYKIDKAAFKEV